MTVPPSDRERPPNNNTTCIDQGRLAPMTVLSTMAEDFLQRGLPSPMAVLAAVADLSKPMAVLTRPTINNGRFINKWPIYQGLSRFPKLSFRSTAVLTAMADLSRFPKLSFRPMAVLSTVADLSEPMTVLSRPMAVLSTMADLSRFIKVSGIVLQEREVWGYLCRDEMRLSQCRACLQVTEPSTAAAATCLRLARTAVASLRSTLHSGGSTFSLGFRV